MTETMLSGYIMDHYMWVLWNLSHQKIALNHSFSMVLLPLNFLELLQSYNQNTTWVLCRKNWVPDKNGFFSLSFDSLDMKLIGLEREVKGLSSDIGFIRNGALMVELLIYL